MTIFFFSLLYFIERSSSSSAAVNGSASINENESGDCKMMETDRLYDDNLFYKSVTEVNHLCVKEQVLDIIDNILKSS